MKATKFDPGSTGFAIVDSTIVGITVNKVFESEEVKDDDEVANECTTEKGDTIVLNDTEIFDTPQDAADSLVAAYNASHPAPESIVTGTGDTTSAQPGNTGSAAPADAAPADAAPADAAPAEDAQAADADAAKDPAAATGTSFPADPNAPAATS